jgi:hypothetical protein
MHRRYAQAHDDNEFHNVSVQHSHTSYLLTKFRIVIGHDLEYFSQAGLTWHNAPVAQLYEDAIRNEGAIIPLLAHSNFSGKKTGRSPKDRRIVFEETSKNDIWWGSRGFLPLEIGLCLFCLRSCF